MARAQLLASFGSDNSDGSLGFKLREKRDLACVYQDLICAGVEATQLRCMPQSQDIACVVPSTDRPPKWARRLANNAAARNALVPQDANPGVDNVVDRLRNLEKLVTELRGQLEQAHAVAGSASDGSYEYGSPCRSTQHPGPEHPRNTSPATNTSSVQKHFGRLVLQDTKRSRYVSSGFWSRVNDELEGLKMDTRRLASDESDSSDDEASSGKSPSNGGIERTPSERHGFLFGHNLNSPTHDLRGFHPLPSQIPFLLDVFAENVNIIIQIVHIPTVTKMVRDLRGSDITRLSPANEALIFSIYYAAMISMDEDEVMINFGYSKTDLSLKYRLGLEHALAEADFLNRPEIVLVQAFALFLCVVRRHDSPRFVWMMTGLVIRMAQYLGLQRDGSHFEHLTPFEIEMRRRVWWAVCLLDVRASEDQGTDLTIPSGSFDTKVPLNINDADINPETREMPTERSGMTDMSFARMSIGLCDLVRQMMAPGVMDGAAGQQNQSRLLNEIYLKYEHGYFPHATEPGNIAYWLGVTIARLVRAKMTLLVSLPVLFTSPSEHSTDEIRNKLLVSAIEVAEYNHAINADQACRQWHWICQTYTHWHAIVYLLIEISLRPWSSIVERAWVALHSRWLIPAQTPEEKNLRIWFPLRKLMSKARKHRDAELNRLRANPQAAVRLDVEDQKIPTPSSSGFIPTGSSGNVFRDWWCLLVKIRKGPKDPMQTSEIFSAELADPSTNTPHTSQPAATTVSVYDTGDLGSNTTFMPTYLGTTGPQIGKGLESTNIRVQEPAIMTHAPSEPDLGQTVGLSYSPFATIPSNWSDGRTTAPGLVPWLWADADPSVDMFSNVDMDPIDVNMDLDGEVNWYNWVESAEGLEREWIA